MTFEYRVKLELTKEQLVALWEILRHVRLGGDNVYKEAISKFMIDCESLGIEDFIADYYGDTWYSAPSVGFTFNDEEGFVIEISEAS
jgi:hypothetical protein